MKSSQNGKTCISCSLPKPISAFLQISGPQGTTYGNICSTCRGSTASQKIIIPAEAETTDRGAAGYRIDNKAKVIADKEKLEKQLVKDEEKQTERLENKENLEKNAEAAQEKETLERKHREGYIAPVKSFLTKRPAAVNVEKKLIIHAAVVQEQLNLKQKHENSATQEEQLVKTTDFSKSFWDPAFAGGIKDSSPEMLRIRAWLGESAAANRFRNIYSPAGSPDINAHLKRPANVSQIFNNHTEKKPAAPATPKPSSLNTFSKTFSSSPQSTPNQSPMIDFIQDKWDPSSPGSRKR